MRVKPNIKTPKFEWGRVTPQSVGVVKAIKGPVLVVDFPIHQQWKGLASEMEVAPEKELPRGSPILML